MRLLERFDGLGHTLFGAAVMAAAGLAAYAITRNVSLSAWIGWAVQSAYWFGRERRDYEKASGIDPHCEWYRGWNVFKWSQRDLWCPVVVLGVVAAVV